MICVKYTMTNKKDTKTDQCAVYFTRLYIFKNHSPAVRRDIVDYSTNDQRIEVIFQDRLLIVIRIVIARNQECCPG